MMGTISVSNLGKAYKQYPSRWSRLAEWLTPGDAKRHQLKWVLQDINFTVNAGEAVGIIGINGTGKSTLLKLITGTTQPTTGSVHMSGHVAAMLELGMGFHPDFTGRQNAFMAGQLLGIPSHDIARLMPEIEAFAEIGEYIDSPVRVYSSGMQMRLAFSVATAIRPDILIVDEALSVGDAYFQHKSFTRIREFRKQGTTLLIVSHDKQAIISICDRAILLNAGRVAKEGNPEGVLDYYNALLANSQVDHQIQVAASGTVDYSGTQEAIIDGVTVCDKHNQAKLAFGVSELVKVKINALVKKDIESVVLGIAIKDKYGQVVFGTNSHHLGKELTNCRSGDRFNFTISLTANFGPGVYAINLALHSGSSHLNGNYHWIDRAAMLQVNNIDKPEFVGVTWTPVEYSIERGVLNDKLE